MHHVYFSSGFSVSADMFYLAVAIVGIERLLELLLAKQNAKYIRSLGGYEIAEGNYKWIVIVHIGFFAGLLLEAAALDSLLPFYWVPAILFMIAQALRVWILATLGRRWNTRIFVVPGAEIVTTGLYRYLRHPNYVVVCMEFLTLPLTFGLYRTSLLFSILNLIVLRQRIREEEKALNQAGNYSTIMSETPKFIPVPKSILHTFKRYTKE